MKIAFALVILSLTILKGSAKSARFVDCGSVDGTVIAVDVTPCNSDPCVLVKGTTPKVTITFTSKVASNTLTSVVHGVIADVPVPFPLPQPNVCKDSGVVCPVAAGSTYNYTASVGVKEAYPSISLTIKWEIKDDQNKDLICFLMPAAVGNE